MLDLDDIVGWLGWVGLAMGDQTQGAIHTVRVSNVSAKATEHDIQDFFSFSGEIDHIELHK